MALTERVALHAGRLSGRTIPRGRLALYLAIAGVLLVLAVPAVSYYRAIVAPSNAWVSRVDGDTVMTRGDLVHAVVVRQMLSEAPTDLSSLSGAPFLVAQQSVRNELTRRGASSMGIVVTASDVEAAVRERFYPTTRPGEQSSTAELDQAYRASYTNYLGERGVSHDDYRGTVETRLYRERMIAAMPGGVAELEAWLTERWAALAAEVRLDSDVYAQVIADVRAALPRSFPEAQGVR